MPQSTFFSDLCQAYLLDSNTRLPRGRSSDARSLNMPADYVSLSYLIYIENRLKKAEALLHKVRSRDPRADPRSPVGSYIPISTSPTSSALASTGPAGHGMPRRLRLSLRIDLWVICPRQCLCRKVLPSSLMLRSIEAHEARHVVATKMAMATRPTKTR
jgi:hypothetical protein